VGEAGDYYTTPEIEINTMTEIISTIDEINESLSTTTKILLNNSVEYVDVSKNGVT